MTFVHYKKSNITILILSFTLFVSTIIMSSDFETEFLVEPGVTEDYERAHGVY